MRVILAAAIAAAITTSAYASALSDAVQLHLIRTAGWAAVSCPRDDFEGEEFIYCHPAGNDRVGALMIERDGVLYRVNGKAMQYVKPDRILGVDNTPIQVKNWTGAPVDIPGAIKEALSFW